MKRFTFKGLVRLTLVARELMQVSARVRPQRWPRPIRLNLSIARSRRRNGEWLFSARLLAQRPTSCFSTLPSCFIVASQERRPSVSATRTL